MLDNLTKHVTNGWNYIQSLNQANAEDTDFHVTHRDHEPPSEILHFGATGRALASQEPRPVRVIRDDYYSGNSMTKEQPIARGYPARVYAYPTRAQSTKTILKGSDIENKEWYIQIQQLYSDTSRELLGYENSIANIQTVELDVADKTCNRQAAFAYYDILSSEGKITLLLSRMNDMMRNPPSSISHLIEKTNLIDLFSQKILEIDQKFNTISNRLVLMKIDACKQIIGIFKQLYFQLNYHDHSFTIEIVEIRTDILKMIELINTEIKSLGETSHSHQNSHQRLQYSETSHIFSHIFSVVLDSHRDNVYRVVADYIEITINIVNLFHLNTNITSELTRLKWKIMEKDTSKI